MEDQDETGGKVFRVVELVEGIKDDLPNRFEEAVEK